VPARHGPRDAEPLAADVELELDRHRGLALADHLPRAPLIDRSTWPYSAYVMASRTLDLPEPGLPDDRERALERLEVDLLLVAERREALDREAERAHLGEHLRPPARGDLVERRQQLASGSAPWNDR
jgi:hypothetical protein